MTTAGVDADGPRRAMLYFPPNTTFKNFTPPGGPLAVQITEYTRANGPQRMPGELPPTSGYTYAVELAFPAATAAGVMHPEFDNDVDDSVVLYVDNFTNYPVGETVPLGYYDETKGAWMAERSGRIVQIVGQAGGLADIDITGDGVAESDVELGTLGIDANERAALAGEYPISKQLWRSTLQHFSSPDLNWGAWPPRRLPASSAAGAKGR